jgi:hypothetical protein
MSFKTGKWLAIIAVVVVILALALAVIVYELHNGNSGTNPQYTIISTAVHVIDPSTGASVPNVPVYFVVGNPGGTSVWEQNQSNTTDSDGYVQFSADYTFKAGDNVYLGASTNQAFLLSDFQGRKFDGSGEAGTWDNFSYDLVKYSQGTSNATINAMISVDNTTGKMI